MNLIYNKITESEEHESTFKIFGWEPSVFKIYLLFSFIMLMLITFLRLSYEKTKMKMYVPESCLLVIVGVLVGFFVLLCT